MKTPIDNMTQITVQDIEAYPDDVLVELYEIIKLDPHIYDETVRKAVYDEMMLRHKRKLETAIFTGKESKKEYQYLEKKYKEGLSTGYDELDEMFTLMPQQLYLISSPTHWGKTTYALNICARAASTGTRVLFCSLEQGLYVVPRIESILGGEMPETLSILTSNSLLSVENLAKTVAELDPRPEILCVDHLHFIEKTGKSVTESMDIMILTMQEVAKRLEMPVIVIAHMRKLNHDGYPTLDDLRDSSSLAQVPAVVMLLHRIRANKDEMSSNYLTPFGTMFVAKNRIQGITGARKFTLEPSGNMKFLTGKQMEELEQKSVHAARVDKDYFNKK